MSQIHKIFMLDLNVVKKIIQIPEYDNFINIFKDCYIMLTSSDYVEIIKYASETDNQQLEKFVNNDKIVKVFKIYNDPQKDTSNEFYFRRIWDLNIKDVQRITLALNSNASIISDNISILLYASTLGAKCMNVNTFLNFNRK